MQRAWHAVVLYAAVAIVATWPVARGLDRNVAGDLGDPVLTMWVLGWNSDQLLAILRGDFGRLATYFDANIFHPAPLTLAYSELFIPQAVQALPLFALTGNPILCYNLLFLSTFVLSGLGGFLLVRELTGDARAGFVGGLLFAFAPYRFPQTPHLQVLSSQWMPFALYGLRRYFTSIDETASAGRWRPLLGACAALVVQNLSCGYYLMFFEPFVAAYVLWEIWQRRAWRNRAIWLRLSAAAALVVILTLPLLIPYLLAHESLGLERGSAELVRYSADVYSYATASPQQAIWGETARAFPQAEGDLFPGLVPLLLALTGVVFWRSDVAAGRTPLRFRAIHWLLLAVTLVHAIAAVITTFNRRLTIDLGIATLRMSNVDQLLIRAVVAAVILLVLSPELRARCAAFMRARGFFLAALLAAMWLSLGPSPHALGRPVNLFGPYQLLYDLVPGFDGLRVPARFGMIVVVMLSVLGGYGAAVVARRRGGMVVLSALAVLFLTESVTLPFTVNGVSPLADLATPEARVYRPSRAPAVYHAVPRDMPVVLAELPLGQQDYDLRAMFYSMVHHARLLNGYSGFFPPHYGRLALALSDVPRHPDPAWTALKEFGATHVLIHEGVWPNNQGPNTTATLVSRGAHEIFRDGADVLLKLP
ncbi:MAG TPA: hypothetical protein VFB85_08670 [Vicinamibacterales bacterium]|jgi:hypothetical protein|nr:hypothetical protein [Vicinamibacterales bacterium]